MNKVPLFEPLEDRIVLDAEPVVDLAGPPVVDLGAQDVEFTITFENDGTDTGYAPYIDLYIPTAGPDGVYPGTPPGEYDGITFDDATYLGVPVDATEITFDENGEAVHPYATDAMGDPLVVDGTPGDTLVVLSPPYGSFAPDNEPIEIVVTLDFSELADFDEVFQITANGGFALGEDGLDNPTDDPSIVGPSDSTNVAMQLFEITKTNNAPENEAATGPSYPYRWTYEVSVAPGQTLSDFTLTDALPHEIVYLGGLSAGGGTVISQPGVGDPVDGTNDQLVIEFDELTGTVTVAFDFYIAETSTDGGAVLDPVTGNDTGVTNEVTGAGNWIPIDVRDDELVVQETATDTIDAVSIAVQKDNAIITDVGPAGASPGDVYEFTLEIEISDYFTYGDILIEDVLGDGWQFVDGSATFVTVEEDGGESGTFTDGVDLTTTFDAATGLTTNVFDLSAAMAAEGDDGRLTGHLADGVPTTVTNTRATIAYRAEILDAYRDPSLPGDPAISEGDRLSNDVMVTANVRNNAFPAIPTGDDQSDDSSSEVLISLGQLAGKEIFAINGDTSDLTKPVAPGDTVTFAIAYDHPLGADENFTMTDILPEAVFDAAEVTVFNDTQAGVPAAGEAQFGPDDGYSPLATDTPALSTTGGNGLEFEFGTRTIDPPQPVRIQILFTVTVKDTLLAPDLVMTNQLVATSTNSFGEETTDQAIARVDYAEPVLSVTKGVIAADATDTNAQFVGSRGPVTFADPGTGGPAWTGVIDSDGLAASPIDANLIDADAEDLVRFAIVVENTGSAPAGAYDVVIKDTLPPGYQVPPGGVNLSVTDGAGNAIAFNGAPGDLFTAGIELVDPGPTGALAAYDPTSGANIVVVTYDLQIQQTVSPVQTLENTAALTNYAAFDGGIDRTPIDLVDDASVNIEGASITKTIETNEFAVGTLEQVIVGEEFTWLVEVDLPEAFGDDVTFTDAVTGGDYTILGAEIVTMGANFTSSAGVAQGSVGTVNGNGSEVSFDFGTLTNLGDADDTNDTIVFRISAQSADADGAVAGDVLQDTATMARGGGGSISASAGVTLIEPDLVIKKSATPIEVDAADVVTYTIDVTNPDTANGAPAYDLVLTDELDPLLTLQDNTVRVFQNGVDVTGGPGVTVVEGNGPGDSRIEIHIDELAEGDEIEVTYDARLTILTDTTTVVTNTADLTYDSLPVDDDPDERDYQDSDDATVQSKVPQIDKTVVSTSNADTPDDPSGTGAPDLAIGEEVTFELVISIPEGIVNDLVITDALPTLSGGGSALQYVSSEVLRIGNADDPGEALNIRNADLGVGDAGPASGSTATFDFGDVYNVPNGSGGADDQIVVRVTARVVDDPDNAGGDVLTNTGTVSYDGGSNSDGADVALVEPVLDIAKSPDPAIGDAGDTITYTVTLTNGGGAPAYDIEIEDDLADAGLDRGPGVPTIVILDAGGDPVVPAEPPAVAWNGGVLEATIPVLMPGETIEIVYDAVITDAAEFAGEVENTAVVARYDTDAGDGAPGEREYIDAAEATAEVTTPGIGMAKDVIATDNPDTDGTEVAIGEEVTYRITLDIPEGTDRLSVTDVLPAGMTAVAAEVEDLGNATSANLDEGDDLADSVFITVAPDGSVVFDFGLVTNPGDNNPGNDQISVLVTTRVDDAAGNVDGIQLTDTATASVLDAGGDPRESFSDTATVEVIEPVLDIAKSADLALADAGDTVTYTVTSTNTGDAPAYDIVLSDDLSDAGLEGLPGGTLTIQVLDDGVPVAVVPAPTVAIAGGVLTANVAELQPGQTIEVVYQAVFTDQAKFSSTVENTAVVAQFDTAPGAGDEERVYTDTDEATASVATPDATMTKSLFGTDIAGTAGSDVTVGEIATYEITITLPQGTGDLVLTDAVPEGLTVVSASVFSMGDVGQVVTSENLIPGATDASGFITIGAAGDDVTFDFGTVLVQGSEDSAAVNSTIVLRVDALVEDVAAVADGVNLTNTATLVVLDPNDPGTALQPPVSDDETVSVVEPDLVMTKDGPEAADPGDEIDYTLTITNNGSAPAFDVRVADTMQDPELSLVGIGSVVVTPPDGATISPSGDGFEVLIDEIPVGSTVTIGYTAQLDPGADARNFLNVGTGTYDTVPDGTPDTPTGRQDNIGAAHIIGTGPTLEKTVASSSFPETGSSEHAPGLVDLNVGEEVTYTITAFLPEIPMDSVVLVDTLDHGLEYVSHSVTYGADLQDTPAAPAVTFNGNVITFDFGDIDHPLDVDPPDTDDAIILTITARVTDTAESFNEALLTNLAELTVTPENTPPLSPVTASVDVEVVEPDLTIEKAGPVAADPGDVVDYTLTIQNEGTGPAYDVTVSDPLGDPYLDLVPASVTVTRDGVPTGDTIGTSGDGFTLTLDDPLLPGQSLVVTYRATLDPSAPAAETRTNTAVVDYDSADGELVGDRDASDNDDHTIGTNGTIAKSVTATSIPQTGTAEHDPTVADLNVGELVTYDVVLTLPEIAMDEVLVVDTLEPGLVFVSGQIARIGDSISGSGTIAGAGDTVTAEFINLVNTADGVIDADDTITLRIVARVADVAASTDGAVLTNTAVMTITPDGAAPLDDQTATADVEVVEPLLEITKDGPSTANPGDVIDYTLTIENTGTGPAFDAVIADPLLSQYLDLVPGSVVLTLDGTPITPPVTETATGFRVTVPTIPAGSTVEVAFQALLDEDVPPVKELFNFADIEYDTVPDGDPDTPTGRPGDDQAAHAIATIPLLSKAAVSTDFAETGSDQHDPTRPDLNIGEEVTYELTLTLPEVDMDSIVLADTLAPGLEYISARVLSVGSDITLDGATSISVAGQVVTIDFGSGSNALDLLPPNAGDEIVVELVARVADVPGNIDGTVLVNTAQLDITPDGDPPLNPAIDTAPIDVVEPELVVEKTGPGAADPGDVIDYTVTIENQGTGPAYDVVVEDTLSDPYLTLMPGSVAVTVDGTPVAVAITPSVSGFEFSLPVAVLPGQTVVVAYQAGFSSTAPVVLAHDNTVAVDYDSADGEAVDDRDDSDGDVHSFGSSGLITKTVLDTGFVETRSDQHDPALVDLNVGETVTYDLVLTLPEGAMDSVVLLEQLEPGLVFVSTEVTQIGGSITGIEDPVVTGSGNSVAIRLTDVLNTPDGILDQDDRITMRIVARVADVPEATDGAVLTNNATMIVTPENRGPLDPVSAAADIEVVEPVVTVDKTVNDPEPFVGDTVVYTVTVTNTDGTGPAFNTVLVDDLPFQLSLTGAITLSDGSLATVVNAGGSRLVVSIPLLMPGQTLTIEYEAFVGYSSPVLTDVFNVAVISGSSSPDEFGRPVDAEDPASIVVEPTGLPPDEDPFDIFGPSEIDDAMFLPILTIDPIYTGMAQPGANVTVALYDQYGGLQSVRSILADAGGSWIVSFPEVELAGIDDDFELFDDDGIFDAPVRMLDDAIGFGGEQPLPGGRIPIGPFLSDGQYSITVAEDRPGFVPLGVDRLPLRVFFAPAINEGTFGNDSVLDIDKVFENVAARSVESLYQSSVNPVGPGLNRFNYDFMSHAGGIPGGIN